ncbi:GMC oxidoreductase-domain-containing protein [Roridomyces roridus]|uniref:GMC oxidoreductase-domain-containing protein n=1 Tax=Roridomyces roridus TaxID=1738132 RepID=A0AAD7B6G2_9AGAR|nr:GMC oxidoreductase-domain-containing protein [Roridomyces roridus]
MLPHKTTAGNTIRSGMIDLQPLHGFLNATEMKRAEELLRSKPELLSENQFALMKKLIQEDVPHMEWAWNIAADANNVSTLTFDRIILSRPFSRGFVHINSTDPLVDPLIDPKYLSAPIDKFLFAKGIEYTRKIVSTEPLKSIIAGPVSPSASVESEDDFVDFVNEQGVAEHHFVGTSSMIPRSEGGVVDPSMVVYGTSNVRVADLSIISNLPGIHTVSLAYMVAERAAEVIKATSKLW